jgi:hypothetical protein
MKPGDWLEILRKIPPEDHDALLLATYDGLEVSIQNILRMDEKYMVIRGRIGGTDETGLVFCLPYERLSYLLFTRDMGTDFLTRVFGELRHTGKPSQPVQETAEAAPEGGADATAPEAKTEQPPTKPEVTTQSLRERLRSRLHSQQPRTRGG